MKIYLATPYSSRWKVCPWTQRWLRFRKINKIAAGLMREGHHVYSPISHTHPIARAGDLPKGWEFWKAYDKTFILWCDEVWIYKAPGWHESKGVLSEIVIARELGRPIRFIEKRKLLTPKPK